MFQILQNNFIITWLQIFFWKVLYYTKNKNHWYTYNSANTFTMLKTDAITTCYNKIVHYVTCDEDIWISTKT